MSFLNKLSFFLLFTFTCQLTTAQTYDGNHLPDTYQSPTNPFYWKNKIPDIGYWQQDVAYKIEAQIDDSTDIINGEK